MENRRSNEKHKCISTNKLIQTFTEIAQQKFQVVSFAAFKRSVCSSRSKRHVLGPNKEREIWQGGTLCFRKLAGSPNTSPNAQAQRLTYL